MALSTHPAVHGASYESRGPAGSYVDTAGGYLDLDAGATFAQVGAKGPGSIGLKLRTVLAGVALTVLTFTSAGVATFLENVSMSSGKTFAAQGITATTVGATGLVTETCASALVYAATDNTKFNVAQKITNTTTGLNTNAFIQFYNAASVVGYFGVVQNASGYGDFVWNSYSGAYAEVGRLTSAGALTIAAGFSATTISGTTVSSTGLMKATVGNVLPGIWASTGTLTDGHNTAFRLSGTATSGSGIIGRIEFYNSVAVEADTAMGNLKFVRDGANNSSAFAVRLVAAGAGVDPAFMVYSSGIMQVGNAYVAGAPGITGYIIVKDNTGTSYKVSVST